MRAAVIVAGLGCCLLACKNNPSKLDNSQADPWNQPRTETSGAAAALAAGDSSGIDWQNMFDKIRDAIETPGPYESPKHSASFDATKPHWAVLGLDGDIVEREAFSLTGGGRGTELHQLIARLRGLAKDQTLTGLILRIDELKISLPDVVELRAAMNELRTGGKQLRCHVEDARTATYLVLTACDTVGIAPLGDIMITGPSAMPIHVKPLLDKLGVTADFIHVGAYKGAAEPLTRNAPSKEMEETLGAILDRHYDTIVDTIATARKIDPPIVKTQIDTTLFPSEQAKAAKLVDEVVSWEQFRDELHAPWTKIELDADEDKTTLAASIKLMRFLGMAPPEKPLGGHVALIYALGDIVDGDGDGVIGARQQIASHTLVSALRALTADDSVKAVVLRIDSGGGSAQASELIWAAVEELKAKKPVVVSMSDVAASGGYYIASGANKIFAHADTLTGSIGVIGGHIAPGPALAKLGINTFPMGRGKHATMMSSLAPWTDEERALMLRNMEAVYTAFVGRVAQGRKLTPEQVQPIAQGRVWTGTKAKELGLVDEIGGLDAALAEARTLAKLPADTGIEMYPGTPTLRDVLSGWGAVHTPYGMSTMLGELRAIDPWVASMAEHLVSIVATFRATPIQTIAILPELQ
jgi:protease-4